MIFHPAGEGIPVHAGFLSGGAAAPGLRPEKREAIFW
jgi:hypothetical protein